MVGVNISVDGRKKNFARTDSEALLEEAAAEIEDIAKSNTPVKTGNLVNSIGVQSLTSRSATVGTNVDYGVYVENGTVNIPAKNMFKDAMDRVRAKYSGSLVFTYDRGY